MYQGIHHLAVEHDALDPSPFALAKRSFRRNADFVNAIRTNQPMNEAEHVAQSTLIGILGRTAAYTGKEVTWEEMMESNERLGPTEYAMGPVPIKAEIPVPGNAANIAKNARTA